MAPSPRPSALATPKFVSPYSTECFTHKSGWWDRLLGRPRFANRIIQQDRNLVRVELTLDTGSGNRMRTETCQGPDSVGERLVSVAPWARAD